MIDIVYPIGFIITYYAEPAVKEKKKKQDAARAAAPGFKEKKKKQKDARRAKERREIAAVAKAALASSSLAPSSLATVVSNVGGVRSAESAATAKTTSATRADADSNKENIVPTPSVRVIRPSGAGSDTTAAIVRVDHANAATPPKSLAGFGDQLMAHTYTNTNPSTQLANTTWVRFGEGKCVVGVSDTDADFAAGATGGSKQHTLLENEMPSHSHTFADSYRNTTFPGADFSYGPNWAAVPTNVIDQADTTNSAGGSQPFNIMNPYISCYMWRRTA